jgi:hypothetical protein
MLGKYSKLSRHAGLAALEPGAASAEHDSAVSTTLSVAPAGCESAKDAVAGRAPIQRSESERLCLGKFPVAKNRLNVLILALSRFVCIDPRLRDKDPWI